MNKFITLALLATLLNPLSLFAQAKLEENLKAVMLLFDKNQKEAANKIDELNVSNNELSTSNLKLNRELETVQKRINDLEQEATNLRSKLSDTAVTELETAALTTPIERPQQNGKRQEPIPDFTPAGVNQNRNQQGGAAEPLSEGTLLLVNINTATDRELRMIPGVGPQMSERIIENRPYASVWDLMKLQGMGKQRIERIGIYITTE